MSEMQEKHDGNIPKDILDGNRFKANNFINEIFELEDFVTLSLEGLFMGTQLTESVRLSRRVDQTLKRPSRYGAEENYEKALESAQGLESFAKDQQEQGFPYLFELASVRLWGILESMVDELVIDLIKFSPEVRQVENIKRIKGPLVDFVSADEHQRAEYLISELKRDTKTDLQQGVGKLEALISAIGLGGSVEDSVRRTLWELSHIRNVIVHRNRKTDKQLLAACPWLKLEVGENVRIQGQQFHTYTSAAYWYALELHHRLVQNHEYCRIEPEEADEEFLNSLLSLQNEISSDIKEYISRR